MSTPICQESRESWHGNSVMRCSHPKKSTPHRPKQRCLVFLLQNIIMKCQHTRQNAKKVLVSFQKRKEVPMSKSRGIRFEKRFFGIPDLEHPRQCRRLCLEDALFGVIRNQPKSWYPEGPQPNTPAANLFLHVFERLPEHWQEKLRLYVSIGTCLDYHHQTDGFFTIELVPNISLSIVRFDLTAFCSPEDYQVTIGKEVVKVVEKCLRRGYYVRQLTQNIADRLFAQVSSLPPEQIW